MENKAMDSDLIRGHIDTIILKCLQSGDRYGYDICKEVEDNSNGRFILKQPTLYSCLKRLESQSLISSYWTDSDIGGKRHYYKITELGSKTLAKNQAEWQDSKSIIDGLVVDAHKYSPIEESEIHEKLGDTGVASDMIRGNIDTIILKVLIDGDRYGYDICKEVEDRSKGSYELKQPTLYSCLKRMEAQQLITSYWTDSDIGGKRHYYKITEAGEELLEKNQQDWLASKEIIDHLISSNEVLLSKGISDNNAEEKPQIEMQESYVEVSPAEIFDEENEQGEKEQITDEISSVDFDDTKLDDKDVEEAIENLDEYEDENTTLQTSIFPGDEKIVEQPATAEPISNVTDEDFSEQKCEPTDAEIIPDHDFSPNAEAMFIEEQTEESVEDNEEMEEIHSTIIRDDDEDEQEETNQDNIDKFNELASSTLTDFEFEDDEDYEDDDKDKDDEDDEEEDDDEEDDEDEDKLSEDDFVDEIDENDDSSLQVADEIDTDDDILPQIDETEGSFNTMDEVSVETEPKIEQRVEEPEDPYAELMARQQQIIDKYYDEQLSSSIKDAKVQPVLFDEDNVEEIEEEPVIEEKDGVQYATPIYNSSFADLNSLEPKQEVAVRQTQTPVVEQKQELQMIDGNQPLTITPSQPIEKIPFDQKLFQGNKVSGTFTDSTYKKMLNELTAYGTNTADDKADNVEDFQIEPRKAQDYEPLTYADIERKFSSQGISVRPHTKRSRANAQPKTNILCNKLSLTRAWCTFAVTTLFLLIAYMVMALSGKLESNFLGSTIYFICAIAVTIIWPMASSIIYWYDPGKRKPARYAPRVSIMFGILFFIQSLLIIYSINLQIGLISFGQQNYNHLNWIVPLIVATTLIAAPIIYYFLYKSKKFHI